MANAVVLLNQVGECEPKLVIALPARGNLLLDPWAWCDAQLTEEPVIFYNSTLSTDYRLANLSSGLYESDPVSFYDSALSAEPPMNLFDALTAEALLGLFDALLANPSSGLYYNILVGFLDALSAKPLCGSGSYESDPLAIYREFSYAIRSNQGESSGGGGRAGEERNGRGGDGNQGIGGGVGGGGQREGIGNELRGSRGRSHGGGNGDDDDNDRRGWVGYIEDERRPMGPRPGRIAEILLPFNFQIFATVESLDITGLSVRVRILRVVSLGFTSVALVCLSASIRRRGTNPRLASILSWIGSVATFLGFISMIAMGLLASFIP